ncbi:MAG: hypothetical protein K0S32_2431 [Bacteroidetes bacterium]|jgi:hypothetical protein|nr:hypothetical protein [Bacteroidota bacterium]
MKKAYLLCFFLLILAKTVSSQTLTYTFTSLAGTFNALATSTAITEIYWGADDDVSPTYSIGFSFQFGCTTYTRFAVSSNGWLTFNTSAFSSDPTNDLPNNTTMRPGIAPLWDDLCYNNNTFPPPCGYAVTGTAPNRTLTVQWRRAYWKILGGSPGAMSYQVRLMESTNRIEMVYLQESGTLNAPSASIGLAGVATGDYYSVNTTFTGATKTTNVTTIASKPANGLTLRWDPPCTTLPIHLVSFTGEHKNGKNIIRWVTGSEKNNDHFLLERSEDGINFKEIKKIKGAGDNASKKNYEETDEAFPPGIVYYRLRQNDHDGRYTYSDIITLTDFTVREPIRFYPNPAGTKIYLKEREGQSYSLINASGQSMKEGVVENLEISVKDLPEGLYILKVKDSFTKVFIKH